MDIIVITSFRGQERSNDFWQLNFSYLNNSGHPLIMCQMASKSPSVSAIPFLVKPMHNQNFATDGVFGKI